MLSPFDFSENRGYLLETVVYQALRRLKKEIYFHKEKKECDFIIKSDLEIDHAIQVCHSLSDPETKERELSVLIDALKIYPKAHGLILTSDETAELEIKIGNTIYEIPVKPIWRWLLEDIT